MPFANLYCFFFRVGLGSAQLSFRLGRCWLASPLLASSTVIHRPPPAHHPPFNDNRIRGPQTVCCPHSTLSKLQSNTLDSPPSRHHHSPSAISVILSKQISSRGSVLGLCLGFAFGGIGVMSVSGSIHRSATALWPLNRLFALVEVRSMVLGFVVVLALLVLGEFLHSKSPHHSHF